MSAIRNKNFNGLDPNSETLKGRALGANDVPGQHAVGNNLFAKDCQDIGRSGRAGIPVFCGLAIGIDAVMPSGTGGGMLVVAAMVVAPDLGQ